MSPCGLGGGQTSTGGPLTEFRRGRRSLPLPSERVKSRAATEESGLSWSWLPGGPLTEFRRGRRSPPLPSERVKIRSRHVGPCCPRGSALTDFRRRWRNPSASSGQVLPLPQARGGLAGCGSTRAHSTGSGQALRRTPGRLTMNGRGWGTEVGRRGLGAAWDVFSRSGECVQFRGRCVQFSGECVQFLAECVQFRGECVHFGGRCVQLLAGRPGWGWGAVGRRDSSFGRLRAGSRGTAKWSDGGLGMEGRSGRHWCAGIDRGAGSRLKTPG